VTRRPILLLVNPTAGGKPGAGPGLHDDPDRLRPDALAQAMKGRGLVVETRELADGDEAGEVARGAADRGFDVVVGGGDGTVSVVASALVGHPQAALGILALGSFNNIARGAGVPETLDAALDVIAAGRAGMIDCGWVLREGGEGMPFFEAAGVGLNALGFLAINLADRRGLVSGVRALWRALRHRRTPMRVTIDGRALQVRTPAVTVSNGPYFGLGFAVSPDADPTDGVLDVAIFQRMSRWEVLRHFLAVAGRRPRRDPRIASYRARRVTIAGVRRALPAHADSVTIGTTPVTFEVRPGALRLFRP
jgi:diacylglycerol kinase family enzyme